MKAHCDEKARATFPNNMGRLASLSKRDFETENVSTTLQLDLIGTESEDPLEKTTRCFNAVTIYGFDKSAELSKYRYDPQALDVIQAVYVTNVVEGQWAEEEQLELYDDRGQ